MVPNREEIVHARLSTWGKGVLDLPVGRGIPEEIWEQMSLLFGELSKEELLRQVVLTELRKLDTGTKADLNQSAHGKPKRDWGDQDGRGKRPVPQEALQKALQEQGTSRRRYINPPMGRFQARQAHGRRQGQEEAQEKRRLQARR